VDIVVENALGWQRTYRLTLRRAAQIAQYAYGKASNTDREDHFGSRIALSGGTLAVAAAKESSTVRGVNGGPDDEFASQSGAVYVFRRRGMTWQQEAYVKASNPGVGDGFGSSVALSGDTLAVGASQEDSAAQGVNGNQDDDSAQHSGAVYVFRYSGTAWQQEAYLKASNTGLGDDFGSSIALSGDTLAIGVIGEDSAAQGVGGNQDDDTAEQSGAVYVFRYSVTWQQEAYLKASNPAAYQHFGRAVALSGDTLVVGAPAENGGGAVHVFRRVGTAWQQDASLEASNAEADDHFGNAVELSGDTIAVGAAGEDSSARGVGGDQVKNGDDDSGAIYIFH
jgi:trimeric autotransporter adhesin